MAQGLGRGLGSLIPKKTVSYGQNPYQKDNDLEVEKNEVVLDDERIFKVSPNKIDFNPYQPRTFFSDSALNDLAQSIKEHGIIQPLVCLLYTSDAADDLLCVDLGGRRII